MPGRALPLALMLGLVPGLAWSQARLGPEFQVNSFTTGTQYSYAAVASDANANFVVVWTSFGQDGMGYGVFGQRYAASGAPLGVEFQVNSYTSNGQRFAAVAAAADGRFVVVWRSFGPDGSGSGVVGQRYDADGTPQGGEFRVNSYTTGEQTRPAVAWGPNGGFVVVWQSYQEGQAGYSGYGVFGQRYDAAGVPQGAEFHVNSYTTESQYRPAVAGSNGGFVVVWHGTAEQDGDQRGVFGQRYDAGGVRQGGEFQVNSFTTGHQYAASVAMAPSGSFVVVWTTEGYDRWSVSGQRYDAVGTAQGEEFQVNSYTTNTPGYSLFEPRVASAADGTFIVVWQSHAQDGMGYGIFGQRYQASGARLGGEFRANASTSNDQVVPAVAAAADGRFVVVWNSDGQDGSDWGVFGQRFASPDVIFTDGFESSST